MFLPATCPGCEAPGGGPCPRCWASLVGRPVRLQLRGLASMSACSVYDGSIAALVTALKFRGAHRLAPSLAAALSELAGDPVDVVCWIPSTTPHRRRRGYDQGALLGRATARRLATPARRLLRRGRGPPQLGLNRLERLAGPPLRARSAVPSRVLVVDDVVTTGASFEAAAQVLRAAGAREVHGVAVAATRW